MFLKKLVEKVKLIAWWFRYREFDKEIWEENQCLSDENLKLTDENQKAFNDNCELENKILELSETIHEQDREIDKLNYYINDREESTETYEKIMHDIADLTVGFDSTSHMECMAIIHNVRLLLPAWVLEQHGS